MPNSKMPRWLDNCLVVVCLLQYFDLHLRTIPAASITRELPFIPVPCQIGGPSSRSPRQCKCGHEVQVQSAKWCMVHAFDGARAFECLRRISNCAAQLDSPVL